MSEIGLLVTGVLKTGQLYMPNLLEQPPFHSENGVHDSTQSQLSQLAIAAQVTPPEFIQTDRTSPVTSSAVQPNNASTHNKISQQLSSSRPRRLLAQANYSDASVVTPRRRRVSTQLVRFSSRSMPNVSFGNSGVTVRVLQRLLISNGYGMRVDGVFGPFTETAVKAFQNRRNLIPDGIVGQKTWRELTL